MKGRRAIVKDSTEVLLASSMRTAFVPSCRHLARLTGGNIEPLKDPAR
jgi:hypothetical protein